MEPGLYDLTPTDTGYEAARVTYQAEVHGDGTASCGLVTGQPAGTQIVRHPVRGYQEQAPQHMPDDVTQISIIAMRRSPLMRQGVPHIFDVLRWKSGDGSLAYMPAIAIVVASTVDAEEWRPFRERMHSHTPLQWPS
jgi:hypothetical protein